MKLIHTPAYCCCPCHAGINMFEYLPCCEFYGVELVKEWVDKKSRQEQWLKECKDKGMSGSEINAAASIIPKG